MSTNYESEYQNSLLHIPNWNLSECDEIEEELHDKLVPRFSLPVVVKEHVKPIKIIKTPKKEAVIDMGQNMVDWLEMKVRAPKDFEVVIEHCKILQKGNFYNGNIGPGIEQFRCISDDNEKVEHPHFTY